MRRSSGVVDIARSCGVSPSTVCRALNNRTDIKAATRQAVLAACRRLGYSKNLLASSLRLKKSSLLAAIMPALDNELFVEKLFFLKQEVLKAGYLWQLSSYGDHEEAVKLFYETVSMRPAGIIAGFNATRTEVGFLKKNAVAALGYDHQVEGMDALVLDREQGLYRAVSFLLGKGRTRPLLLGAAATSERGRGFLRAGRGAGLSEYEIDDTPFGRDLFEYGYVRMKKLLAKKKRFDAVQTVNDASAIGVMRALHEAGLRVPDEVGVIGFDNIMAAAFVVPALTTVSQPKEKMAKLAVKLLLRRIKAPAAPCQIKILPTQLLKRESA